MYVFIRATEKLKRLKAPKGKINLRVNKVLYVHNFMCTYVHTLYVYVYLVN